MGPARLLVVCAAAVGVCAASGHAASQSEPDLGSLLKSVGERVAGYYRRAQTIVCLETSTVQPIDRNWSPAGMPRTVESDLHLESDAFDGFSLPETKMRREIRRINGRAPRERDKKDRAGCTDPDLLTDDPLSFLLPVGREKYLFTAAHEARERERAALAIDFVSVVRRSRADLIEDQRGHDDCFDWSGPIATRGRVWIDAETHDVLRVDRHNEGPVDLRVSWALQRKYNFEQFFVLDRDDVSMHYTAVAFRDPDETLLLPASIESVTVVRSGLQSTRRTSRYSDYHRFLTEARIR